jgi:HK97 family phage major capsid protein
MWQSNLSTSFGEKVSRKAGADNAQAGSESRQRFPPHLKNWPCLFNGVFQMTAIFTRRANLNSAVDAERSARSAHAFSWSRALGRFAAGAVHLDGYEGEVLAHLARAIGQDAGAGRMPLPLQLLADPYVRPDTLVRDLSKGTLSAGGALVGASMAPVADMLRPWSILANAGVTVVQEAALAAGGGDIPIPSVSSSSSAYWQTSEAADMTQGDPALTKATLSAKSGYVFTRFSRLLARQSDVADALLQRELLSSIGVLIDKAILSGSGASGQPRGIANTVGIAAASGAFSGASALNMEETAAVNGGQDAMIGFVATPAVRKMLKQRSVDAGGVLEQLWKSDPAGDRIVGRSGYVASYATASTIVAGPWNDAVFSLWGVPMLELNPYGGDNFKKGMIEARMVADCDVAILTPAAWTVHSSVS